MFIRVQVNISVYDPRGWVNGVEIFEHFDTSSPIAEQCLAAANEWIERRNRIFGSSFVLGRVLSCFFEHRGFWCSVSPVDSESKWPLSF